jgi:four helix bundle protein
MLSCVIGLITVGTKAAPIRGMQNPKSSIVEHSLDVVALSRSFVEVVQRKDKDLGSQLRRAISSICLNLAEGFGATGGNRRLRFETALGSLNEAIAAIRVAVAWGYSEQSDVNAMLESIGVLGSRIAGLVRKQR